MMRQMRENTKWIMLIVAVAFVGLMVFEWGMDLSGRSGAQASGGELGRVNGDIITYDEYRAVYQNLYQQQQAAMESPITSAMNRQIEEAAWDQLVTQRLLQQELRRRGIRVTDGEIREAAMYAPPPELMEAPAFQTDGQFDPAKYQQFLASPGLDLQFLQQLEAYYRDMIPRSKLYYQNTAGLYVTDGQLWRMWRDARETATVSYIAFQPDALVQDAEVNVTDQAIRQYYNQHRADFVRPALASVRYVWLDRTPTQADTMLARQAAVEHRQAIVGGEDFDVVAARAADRPAGDPFRNTPFAVVRGQSPGPFEDAVFNTPVGQVSEPVRTGGGFHVVRVESRRADTAQVRQILVPIVMAEATENELLDRVDELERDADNLGLEQAAARHDLQPSSGELSPAMPFLPGLGSVEEGVDWAFDDAAVSEVSPVFESEQAFYILELVSRRDEGVLSLQEATPTIRTILVRQAKLERARQLLADAERRARAGEPLDQVAAQFGVSPEQAGPFSRGEFVPGLGRVNAAIGAAFGLQPGATSPLIEAEQRLFIIRSIERQEPNRAEWQAQLEEQRNRVLQAMAESRWSQYMLALREDADIVDNRRQVLGRGPADSATR
jgi:peptidyl-prolyl cis-trans isomerase D